MQNQKKTNPAASTSPVIEHPARGMEDEWLDNAAVLKIFHLSARTSLRWRRKGLEFFKVGKKIFYRRSSIEEFLAPYKHASTPEGV